MAGEKAGDVKDDVGAVVKGVDHEGDDRREDAGNDGLELEILLPVEDLGGEERRAQEGP